MKTCFQYVMQQTSTYVHTVLPSTGVRPHLTIAADKSTPHRDTNHAVLLLLPVDGKRIAVPLDAPLVYEVNQETHDILGGSGSDLLEQITNVTSQKLKFSPMDMYYIRG